MSQSSNSVRRPIQTANLKLVAIDDAAKPIGQSARDDTVTLPAEARLVRQIVRSFLLAGHACHPTIHTIEAWDAARTKESSKTTNTAGGFLKRMFNRLAAAKRRRIGLLELSSLSDHQLRDIGLHRSELYKFIAEPGRSPANGHHFF